MYVTFNAPSADLGNISPRSVYDLDENGDENWHENKHENGLVNGHENRYENRIRMDTRNFALSIG